MNALPRRSSTDATGRPGRAAARAVPPRPLRPESWADRLGAAVFGFGASPVLPGEPAATSAFADLLPDAPSTRREIQVAALNGLVGDHLARGDDPLALPMQLRRGGRRIDPARTVPPQPAHVVVLVHGLCASDHVWTREGLDVATALEREIGATVLTALYNSGLPVSDNGQALAAQLQRLAGHWPQRRISLVGHDLGGLVVRSACDQALRAGHDWPGRLGHLVFLGTPHMGTPLDRAGHWLHRVMDLCPCGQPFTRLSQLRSAGMSDLQEGFGARPAAAGAPLLAGVPAYAVATTVGSAELPGSLDGDGLVPVDSALGRHADRRCALALPRERQWVGHGIHHLEQPTHAEVYRRLRRWLVD